MPAKINLGKSQKQLKEKPKHNNSPVIYEKVTNQEVALSPSAWTIFQDFVKHNIVGNKTTNLAADSNSNSQLASKPKTFPFKDSRGYKLNFDVIWFGIAVGCLVGAVYFLFGGLQPLVLQHYITNAKINIDNIGESYLNQLGVLSSTQNTIIQNTNYNILSDCKVEQKYTKLEEDINKIDNASRSLFPNPNYRSVSKFNGLAETETRQLYEQFYGHYSNSLLNLQSTVLNDIRDLPAYSHYRNNWIDGCILVSDGNSTVQQITDFCQNLTLKTEEYLTNSKPNFWSKVEKSAKNGLDLCQKVINKEVPNFTTWKLQWLFEYGNMTAYTPDVAKNIEKINSAALDFESEVAKYKNRLDEIYLRKISFLGMWYFLEL